MKCENGNTQKEGKLIYGLHEVYSQFDYFKLFAYEIKKQKEK
jgi:hypothetical protein